MALTKYCRCGTSIPIQSKCCDNCIDYYDKQRYKYNKRYDTTKRVNADFYNSQEWKDLRSDMMVRAKGLDLYDYYINHKITRADTVHHIVEVKQDYNRRLDITNLIPLSSYNHSKIHKLYFRKKKDTQDILFEALIKAKSDGVW